MSANASGKPDVGGVVIGIDLGGTKMLAGAVDEHGEVLHKERELTRAEEGAEAVIGRLADLVGALADKVASLGGRRVLAVSIGVPGGVDSATGQVDRAPNLRWEKVPLGPLLSSRTGVPVLLDNDVRVAVLGEYVHGAGRGARSMVGVWVGTGIGGGVILDGQLQTGARGVAGEIGHMIVAARGPRCPCGSRGCIEALASRTSIERELRAAVERGARTRVFKRMKKKGRAELTSSIVARALDDEDPALTKVFARAQRYLGLHAANLINALDPEVIVFGGGMAERLGERFVAPIREVAFRHALSRRDLDRVRLEPTALGEDAPLLGAAVLARRRLAPPSPPVSLVAGR